jgi:hypothetical protein
MLEFSIVNFNTYKYEIYKKYSLNLQTNSDVFHLIFKQIKFLNKLNFQAK